MASSQKTVTKQQRPAQHQTHQPGVQSKMTPEPVSIRAYYKGSEKLLNKVAVISGGDSGIGRAIAIHFAREGAKIAILYLEENEDAEETKRLVEEEGVECFLLATDLREKQSCENAIQKILEHFGGIDILVNNAAVQFPVNEFTEIDSEQLKKTFETNFFSYFFLTQAVLPHLQEGSAIINTGSVTSFHGSPGLIDYSATKGAIQAFTFSLAKSLAERGIRVNVVAPGPIWTPLIPASFSAEKVKTFGADTLMKRAGEPAEVAPAYVFLASEDASYITGQCIHINGGDFIAP